VTALSRATSIRLPDPRWHANHLGMLQRHTLASAADSDPVIQRWENEGGRYAISDETVVDVDRREETAAHHCS
jgi:hypothetical protein